MKAALLRELNALLSVEDVDLEGPRSGEVRVEIVGAGVCHSDHHSIIGRNPPYALPTILGHEGAGTVTDVGPNVEGISGGVDYAFEVIGSPLAIRQAFESVRPGGRQSRSACLRRKRRYRSPQRCSSWTGAYWGPSTDRGGPGSISTGS